MDIRKEHNILFVIFRFVFGTLIFTICFLLVRKAHIIHKRRWLIISFIMTVVFTTILALIPLENAFIAFSSPQSSYQYKNSDDYYITILDTNGGASEITDSRNSGFQCLDKYNSILNKNLYMYCAYINNYDDQYVLSVNDKVIEVQR